jgi:hypothetical protein
MTTPGLRTELDTVVMMRKRMVNECEQLANMNELEFRHVICSVSSPDPVGQLAQCSPDTGTKHWQDDESECPDYRVS